MPVAAPTFIAVAAPPILIVVAVSFSRATVVSLVLTTASTSTSPVNVALPLVSIVKRVVDVCAKSLDVETSPVLITTSPPVALPVPLPPAIVTLPPATFVPMPLVPLSVELVGVVLASALPNTTVLFLITMLLPMLRVPWTTSNGSEVTLASV